MAFVELRQYQQRSVAAVKQAAAAGKKRIVLVMPTGAGKTHTIGALVSSAAQKGNKVLALMHRRGLVEQMAESFESQGIETGMIMAGIEPNLSAQCQIASIQTICRRAKLAEKKLNRFLPDAPFILIDETHHAMSKSYQEVLSRYPNSFVVGLTATPTLASGAGLANYFDELVNVVSMKELIDGGFLVPGEYYGPSKPDIEKLKVVRHEFEQKSMDEQCNKPEIIGNVVSNWFELSRDRQTMVFAINRRHAKSLCAEFVRKGIVAEYLDAYNDDNERSEVIQRFKRLETQVLCQVALYTEGTDIPEIETLIIARPVRALGLWRQILGRGARPHSGKKSFMVIEHGGNTERLGKYEEEINWTLESKKGANSKKAVKKEKLIITCECCSYQFTGRQCQKCGWAVPNYGKKVEVLETKLISLGNKQKKPTYTMADKQRWWSMLEYHRRVKQYVPGWTAQNYRTKFGVWPRGMGHLAPVPPDREVKNWILSRIIAWNNRNKSAA